jgi:hypothetical protein
VHNRGKDLTEGEIQELLSVETPAIDEELTQLTQLDAYQFGDGRILFLFDGPPTTGVLWETRASVLQSLRARAVSQEDHLLAGRFPPGPGFPDQIPELLAKLADFLQLADGDLDFSLESLHTLDARLEERSKPEDRLGSKLFPALVAYLGEVVRQSLDGAWEMRHTRQPDIWEPWVHSPDGREFAPFVCLYEQLTHHGDPSARLARAVPAWVQGEHGQSQLQS